MVTVMLWVFAPLLHILPVALLLLKVMLAPAQRLEGPLIVGIAGKPSTVTNRFALVLLQPPGCVTVTEYVPPEVTEMLWVVSPLLQTFPVALLLVSTTLPPAQKVVGPPAVIVGGGGRSTVTVKAQFTVFVPSVAS